MVISGREATRVFTLELRASRRAGRHLGNRPDPGGAGRRLGVFPGGIGDRGERLGGKLARPGERPARADSPGTLAQERTAVGVRGRHRTSRSSRETRSTCSPPRGFRGASGSGCGSRPRSVRPSLARCLVHAARLGARRGGQPGDRWRDLRSLRGASDRLPAQPGTAEDPAGPAQSGSSPASRFIGEDRRQSRGEREHQSRGAAAAGCRAARPDSTGRWPAICRYRTGWRRARRARGGAPGGYHRERRRQPAAVALARRSPGPPEARVYEEGTEGSLRTMGQRLGGTKRFRLSVVPDSAGSLSLPPIEYRLLRSRRPGVPGGAHPGNSGAGAGCRTGRRAHHAAADRNGARCSHRRSGSPAWTGGCSRAWSRCRCWPCC